MIKKYFLILIALVCLSSTAFTQAVTELQYEVLVKGIRVGSLNVKKKIENNLIHYEIKSVSSVRFFAEFKVEYFLTETWKDGVLLKSDVKSYENGELFDEAIYDKSKRQFDKNKTKKLIKQDIQFSSAMLYFETPSSLVFSEFDGYINKVEKINYHKFNIIRENDGKVNTYIYHNGTLLRADVYNARVNFTLQKLN